MLNEVEILGAGPAGLYTAILIQSHVPKAHVRVTEQNPEGATFGFGVVFSDQALGFLKASDPDIHDLITPQMETWQNMTLNHPEDQVVLDGALAAPGEEGLMFVRGDSSSPTYWNRPDKTADTMRGDWISTGDLFVERDGYFYFQGRADELIKVSGQWVWPMEVERCLNEHKDVNECAVLAHQLDDKRMALRAYVSLIGDVAPNDKVTTALRDFVKSELTQYKAPRYFEFINTLPKTGTGKIDRQALSATHPTP